MTARPGMSPRSRKRAVVAALCVLVATVLAGTLVGKICSDLAGLEAFARADDLSVSPVVLDRNDLLLRAFLSRDDKWRLPVTLAEIDPIYFKLLMAYEDKRFPDHGGVDWRALVRAAGQAVTNGGVVSGGSTLTMQVVRLLDETPTKTIAAKYWQILKAVKLEQSHSKDEILALYSLRAPFGGNLEGVRAASLIWFGKEPRRLTLAEAALLVALPQSPERRRPDRFPANAKAARERVLNRAADAGIISLDDAKAAARDLLPEAWRTMPMLAPHRALQVAQEQPQRSIHRLTLDHDLQARMEELIAGRTAQMANTLSAALMVADHRTGEILASVGSPSLLDEARQGHVDMTRAVRSPGSTLKPLIYGLAFDEGVAHPESLIDDRPIDIGGYKPTNFDLGYQGTVTVRQALQLSLNTPAIQLLEAVGPARLIARLKRAGAHPVLPDGKAPGLAIGLGGVGMTLEDLTALYAALARQGQPIRLRIARDQPIDSAADDNHARTAQPVLSNIAAWHVTDILTGLPQPRSAETAAIAYKTGTAYGYRDTWAVGFDGRHVIAVWVGRADATPVPGQTGAETAAPILFEAFQRLSPSRIALPGPPIGVLTADTANLPGPLQRARLVSAPNPTERKSAFAIVYPPTNAEIDLQLDAGGADSPVVIKLTGGRRPFALLVNGQPMATSEFQRQFNWVPREPGHTAVSVIDSAGRTASVQIRLR